jgi:RND family efflux transporter MFP subunit
MTLPGSSSLVRGRVPAWLAAVLFVLLGAATGWLGARRTEAMASTLPITDWQTTIVGERDIGATVLATGVVRPRVGAQVAVGSRVSGILRELHVTVGDRVVAGQLLAELDRAELEMQVERTEAARASAAAERTYAEGELFRVRQLADRGAAAPAELSAAERAVQTSRAAEREATAAHEAAKVQLGYTSIRAPIGGVVASVSTQKGETVAASFAAPTFVTIVDLSRLEVWAYVDETDIGRIAPGQRATFTVDSYADERFEGRVTAVRPAAELRDNVVNYVTLIEIESTGERLLRPEMSTRVNIVVEGREAAVAVPNSAMRRDSTGSFVLVPGATGVERRGVRVGFRGSEFSEVISGIRPGERVVVGRALECEPTPPTREGT